MATRDSYFREKQIKLDAQFEASRKTESSIFAGVVAAVDGFTGDLTALEIKQIMSRHGGTYAQYVFSPGITHMIASNLPTAKVRKELTVKRRTPLAIVTPQWIIDSLKAKRQLPWGDYTLAQLHAPDQTTLNSWRHSVSRPSSYAAAAASSTTTSSVLLSKYTSDETPFQAILRLSEDPTVVSASRRVHVQTGDQVIFTNSSDQMVAMLNRSMEPVSDTTYPGSEISDPVKVPIFQLEEAEGSSVVSCFNDVVHRILASATENNSDAMYGYEMLNAREILLSTTEKQDREGIFRIFEHVRESAERELSIPVSLEIFDDPLQCYKFRSIGDPCLFLSLPCVPTRLGYQYSDLTVEDAAIALIESEGTKERRIRQICTGQVWRKTPLVRNRGAQGGKETSNEDSQTDNDRMKVLLTAQATLDPLTSSPETIAQLLINRLMTRPRAISMFRNATSSHSSSGGGGSPGFSSNRKGYLLSLTRSDSSNTFSSVSSGREEDLLGETLALVRILANHNGGGSTNVNKDGPLTFRLNVSQASNVNPQSFSQISPQTLKHLPKEVLQELRLAYGKETPIASTPLDEKTKSIMPESFSQLDVDTLRELPEDIRREVEASIAQKRRLRFPDDEEEQKSKPSIPRSFSQVDQSVLKELPADIRFSVQRELMNNHRDREGNQQADQRHEDDGGSGHPSKKKKKKKQTTTQRNKEDDDDEVVVVGEGGNHPLDDGEDSRGSWPETFSQVDRETLSELPPEVALEIEQAFKFRKKAELEKKRKEHLFSFAADRRALEKGPKKVRREEEVVDLTSPPVSHKSVESSRPLENQTQHQFPSDRSLRYESFSKVHDTVVAWISSLHTCPHQDDSFDRCCLSYVETLFEVKELDKVDMLMSLLNRLCHDKRCEPHDGGDCWRFAFQDVKRHVLRSYRQKFNSNLVLTVST